jgi:hypothetical protein
MELDDLVADGFDPGMYSLLIGEGSKAIPVTFDAWQEEATQDAGSEDIPYFDRQQGFVYTAKDNRLRKNGTYLLSTPGPLADALVTLTGTPGNPWDQNDIVPMPGETIKKIEALKERGTDETQLLAKTEDGGMIGLVLFDRLGNEALFSIVYIDETQALFWDNPTEYIDDIGDAMWRVDTVGPGYFDVLFLARVDEGLMLMLNWGAFEGEAIILLYEEDGAFMSSEASLYYRYMPGSGYL